MRNRFIIHIVLGFFLLAGLAPSYADKKNTSSTSTQAHKKTHKKHKKFKFFNKDYMDGYATFYSHKFFGRKMANGERFDPKAYTAAHAKLPLGTKIKVTDRDDDSDDGRVLYLEVTDKMAWYTRGVLDLTPAAYNYLNRTGEDLYVQIEVVSDSEFESHDMNKIKSDSPAKK